MARTRRQLAGYLLGTALIATAGCASKVLVPPRFDVRGYGTIGMIELSSNARGTLPKFASQKLVQAIQAAQPGVRILELGNGARVLGSLSLEELDFEAARAIGERFGVDAVLVGELEVTDVKPRLDVATMITSMSAQADVEASLLARLLETASGATVWTRSASGSETVAHVSVLSGGPVRFGATDPEEAYGALVRGLVHRVTGDFRARWVRQ